MWDYPCMISNFLILLIFVVSYLSMPRRVRAKRLKSPSFEATSTPSVTA